MKVLFVSSGNSHYGIIPFIKRQGVSLIKEGIDLDFYTVKGKGIKGYIRAIRPLRNYINNNNYDIIHAHYGIVGLICGLTFSNKPIVLSIMGDDAYGSFNTDGKRVISSYFIMFLTQVAMLFSTFNIVKSKNILKVVPFRNRTRIIPNGVDFETFKPVTNPPNSNKILFLADKDDPRKNFKLIKEAVDLLSSIDVQLVTPYPIKPEDFPDYLNDSAVFVLTSYNEGSPNVIKEAMACNVPIVSTDVGDVKEVIGNTEGCYISSFDSRDVAEKIMLALDFGKRTSGRRDIQHLESSVVAKRIIEIYKKILER